jgi:hypothetical protein
MSLCPFNKFKNIFGIPNQGVHKYKFLDVSIIDYILTLVLAIIWSYFTNFPLVLSTIISFILAIILHTLFGVPTSAVKYLGLNC